MPITIDLPHILEETLAARAREQGISLEKYLERLLTEPVSAKARRPLTPAERAKAWLEAAKELPAAPAVADEERESIYSSRG